MQKDVVEDTEELKELKMIKMDNKIKHKNELKRIELNTYSNVDLLYTYIV
jgi:hypothetical protein